MSTRALSWKPVRRGAFYCSPACGGRCTYADYNRAKREANAAALSMGRDWTTYVWENLGWHWRIQSPCKRIRIHQHGSDYTAYLGDKNSDGGRWVDGGKSIRAAIRNVVAVAKRDLARIGATLEGL